MWVDLSVCVWCLGGCVNGCVVGGFSLGGWMCRYVGGGWWLGVCLDVSVGGRYLGECMYGFVDKWLVVEWMSVRMCR